MRVGRLENIFVCKKKFETNFFGKFSLTLPIIFCFGTTVSNSARKTLLYDDTCYQP